MHYVYILQSLTTPTQHYIGTTNNLKRRFQEHNRGDSPHTATHRPWKLTTYLAFEEKEKADAFEYYLKTHAGRRFQIRHFGSGESELDGACSR
jgi:putative endonuclease